MVSLLAQANRVAVMVAMDTLLNVHVQVQHVRLAGDALVLKYSVLLVSTLFIALILPSALAELKPILATLVCMPIPSVYIQNAIDNGVNSTAASLAVHTSNIISFALLLILAAASGKICAPWNQQSSASVATQATDPWMSLSIASVASLGVLLCCIRAFTAHPACAASLGRWDATTTISIETKAEKQSTFSRQWSCCITSFIHIPHFIWFNNTISSLVPCSTPQVCTALRIEGKTSSNAGCFALAYSFNSSIKHYLFLYTIIP